MEIINYNRDSNNFPAGGSRGTEGLWDDLLSKGFQIYGTASDDTHDYLGEFLPSLSYPGKGWIMVRAEELSPQAIRKSLERGDFYLSTGVTLEDVSATQIRKARLTFHKTGEDVTERVETWARGRMESLAREDLCGFVFKSRSPLRFPNPVVLASGTAGYGYEVTLILDGL